MIQGRRPFAARPDLNAPSLTESRRLRARLPQITSVHCRPHQVRSQLRRPPIQHFQFRRHSRARRPGRLPGRRLRRLLQFRASVHRGERHSRSHQIHSWQSSKSLQCASKDRNTLIPVKSQSRPEIRAAPAPRAVAWRVCRIPNPFLGWCPPAHSSSDSLPQAGCGLPQLHFDPGILASRQQPRY